MVAERWQEGHREAEKKAHTKLISLFFTIHSASVTYTLAQIILCVLCVVVLIHLLLLFIRLASVFGRNNDHAILEQNYARQRYYGLVQICLITVSLSFRPHRLWLENVKFGRSSVVKWCNLNLMAIVASRWEIIAHIWHSVCVYVCVKWALFAEDV